MHVYFVYCTDDCVSITVLLAHVLSPSGSARLFTRPPHRKWGRTFVFTGCVSSTVFGSTHAVALWFYALHTRTLYQKLGRCRI
jgi:hypothetical protein